MTDSRSIPVTRKQNAIPTNMINYKGRQLPARIDPEARVAYIVEIMASSFATQELHMALCLRDEGDKLVTQSNIHAKVHDHEALKLVPSPATEALAVAISLKDASQSPSAMDSTVVLTDQQALPLKLALFNLSKYIKEEEFAVEFMGRGGTSTLVELLDNEQGGISGNSLAYALQGVRGLLEFESSWPDLNDKIVDKCLHLLLSASQPNILRPATAIIHKLVMASPESRRLQVQLTGKGKAKETDPIEEDTQEKPSSLLLGFEKVFARIQAMGFAEQGSGSGGAPGFLKVITKRLEGTGDLELVAQSLGLINAFLRSGQQENSPRYEDLVSILENLSVRRYVSRLIPTSSNNIVEPQILNFQARYAAVLQHRRHRPVRPALYPEQEKMLSDIWRVARLGEVDKAGQEVMADVNDDDFGSDRNWAGWKRIGLWVDDEVEDGEARMPFLEVELFRDVGDLGLDCLHWFVTHEEQFQNMVLEQEARTFERRCPIGKASAECVKILCEQYKVSQAGHYAPSTFQLFLLNFPRLHSLVLKFFMRMWSESESRSPDFDRLSFLVRSQARLSLAEETSKTWLDLERDFLEADYRTIRDRQMELLEKEDGMFSRPSILKLKHKIGKEAYDVLAEQRVGCMIQGSWFNSSTVIVPGIISAAKTSTAKPLRFLRLSPSRRTLAWGEFAQREATSPSYESLREKIDLANVTDLRLQTGCAIGSRSPSLVSKLSFSLMSGSELSLLDLDSVHSAQLAEWTDGIRVLRGEGGMKMPETANYVHILTELSLKVRLLDITGDGVELPEKASWGLAPRSVDFWFAK